MGGAVESFAQSVDSIVNDIVANRLAAHLLNQHGNAVGVRFVYLPSSEFDTWGYEFISSADDGQFGSNYDFNLTMTHGRS